MAYDFNGTTDKITATATIAGPSSNDGDCTIAAWVYPDGTSGVRNLFTSGSAGYSIQVRQNGSDWEAYYKDGGGHIGAVYVAGVSAGAWAHVAAAYGSTNIQLYHNGVDQANASGGARVNHGTSHSIGNDEPDGSVQFWDGRIAELAIWSVKLTANELAMLAAGYSPLLVRPDVLESYVPSVRGLVDNVAGSIWTASGTTVIEHPRVIYPRRRWTAAVSSGAIPDPPNATYAEDSQPCEGSNGTITPTNTGGAITSAAVASGSLPTGYVLNANGTISKTGASMVVGDIGSRTVYVNLTNAGGTQSNVPVPIVITANPPVLSYAGSPFTKYCAHASTTANITASGPAVPAAGYALSSALGGLALNTTTAVLTFDPDLTEGIPWTTRFITGTTAGGQVGTATIQLRFSYQFTVQGTNAGGSDTATVTLHLGGASSGQGSSTAVSSMGQSSTGRSSMANSAFGGRQ